MELFLWSKWVYFKLSCFEDKYPKQTNTYIIKQLQNTLLDLEHEAFYLPLQEEYKEKKVMDRNVTAINLLTLSKLFLLHWEDFVIEKRENSRQSRT